MLGAATIKTTVAVLIALTWYLAGSGAKDTVKHHLHKKAVIKMASGALCGLSAFLLVLLAL